MHGPVYYKPRHGVNAPNNSVEWLLRHQSKILARVVRDESSPLLWRVVWPDIGPSPPGNLSRCMDAAQQWAERSFVTEHRKNGAARSLKSLGNFSWSASPPGLNGRGVP